MGYKIDPKVRQALDIIDNLITGSHPGLPLSWDQCAGVATVLSAMRGPDNQDSDLKHGTTAVIRATAFPKGAERFGDISREKVIFFTRSGEEDAESHFEGHITSAAHVLCVPIVEG